MVIFTLQLKIRLRLHRFFLSCLIDWAENSNAVSLNQTGNVRLSWNFLYAISPPPPPPTPNRAQVAQAEVRHVIGALT